MIAASNDHGAQADTHRLVLTGTTAAMVRADGRHVPLARLDAALLAVLALEGVASRQRLLQLLWPDDEPDTARNALRQRLFRLRRAIGTQAIAGAELLSLQSGVAHDLDGDGELLAAHDYAGHGIFENWLDAQRGARARRRRERAIAHIDACESDGRYAEGAELAARLVAADALDETAVQRLMKLHYLDGRRAAALTVFERFTRALHDDGGGVPQPATTELLATIRGAHATPLAHPRDIPASVLRPPRLVGCDGELRALAAAWAAGRAFWLLADSGLGKTRLITEFLGDAGVLVAARPGDADVPGASFGRALRALFARWPRLLQRAEPGALEPFMPDLLPQASVAAGTMPVAPRPALRRHGTVLQPALSNATGASLLHAVCALLRDAQRAGLGALVMDDLHFADSASLAMLQVLVVEEGTLRWGFAQRPGQGHAAVQALRAALEEVQRVDVFGIEPLDAAQMVELVESLALPGLDAAQLGLALVRHTGGNPMYALETIKQHIIRGQPDPGGVLPQPASVAQLIERRLHALTPAALQLARVAAVAGSEFTIDVAASVLDTRALALADAWHELQAAHVLRDNALVHGLMREAILSGVPPPIARHTHAAVATFLEANAGEPARIAAHWLAAAQALRALPALHAAADAARRALRRHEEAAFLERAAQIESDAGDRAAAFESLRATVDARFAADPGMLDAALFDRLDAAAAGERQRAQGLARRAHWLQKCGELDQARRLACSAIELADAAGDETTAALARQCLAGILGGDGNHEDASAVLQELLPWASERASEDERGKFCSHLAITLDQTGRGREARVHLQRSIDVDRRLGEWTAVVANLVYLAISWAGEGHAQRAVDILREALALAAVHDTARDATLPGAMYKCLRDCGRYGEALRWVEPTLAVERGVHAAVFRCHVASGWIHLGQHARAQRELDAVHQEVGPDWLRARVVQMRARLKLALGQRAGALFDEALRLVHGQPGRQRLAASIALDHGSAVDPADALVLARKVAAEAERLALAGEALAGHVRAARFAVEAGLAADAAKHADAVLAAGDDVAASDLYPAERWLVAWHALRFSGREDEAAEVLRHGVAWVKQTMRTQVPEPFRDSFAHANEVNRQLLAAE